jgi:hypothetical protein
MPLTALRLCMKNSQLETRNSKLATRNWKHDIFATVDTAPSEPGRHEKLASGQLESGIGKRKPGPQSLPETTQSPLTRLE